MRYALRSDGGRYALVPRAGGGRTLASLRSNYREDQARDDHGRWVDEGGGGGSGSSGGDKAAARERFFALKDKWAQVNNSLLQHVDRPDSPDAQAKMNELKGIVKEMYSLDADPGGLEGIGLPGGPRDMVVVGAGPGGLAAAVMGGTDGLDTLYIDANTDIGGQAKFSSRIENYPGFPVGVTGETLARNMHEQAQRVGAEAKLGVRVTGLTYDEKTGLKTLTLSNGDTVEARTVVLAGGVEFRKLNFDGSESPSVVYGDGKRLSQIAVDKPAVVIGGSNGAAQAALGCAQTASKVYVVSRSPVSNAMSDYQVSAVFNHPRIEVIEGDEILKFDATSSKATLKSGKELDCAAVGVFVGSAPSTSWLPPEIARDRGKVVTDANLETGIPGVFAAGDVRAGGIGRIGAAVGDGQMAERGVFQYFNRIREQRATTTTETARAAEKPKRDQAAWNRLVDDAFDVDADNPFIGQTVEREVDGTVRTAEWDESKHPREENGRFAPVGADDPPADQLSKEGAYARPKPIKVKDIDEAIDRIARGEVVELEDTRAVNTLIGKLADIAKEAKAAGKDAPNYDLCKVTVANTNIFCRSIVRNREFPEGVPRIHMPQLGGKPVPGSEADSWPRVPWDPEEVDGAAHFMERVQSLGIKVTETTARAAKLKASQNELVGTKVASMMRDKSFEPGNNPVFVSRDGYVVDGHHRWAAVVGRDAEDGKLGDSRINVRVIDAPIAEVLQLADLWSQEVGIAPAAGGSKKRAAESAGRHVVIRAASVGTIRTATFDGAEHVVVPVVALVEGVIHAINAPHDELVLAEEFAQGWQGWNGRPVCAGHPTRHGMQVSANHPEIFESDAIGTVFNARLDGKRLLMEAWINRARAMRTAAGRSILERVDRGEPIEVSVGTWVVAESRPGTWNGRPYRSVWRRIVSDHLAMLAEGRTGACSIEMGCGALRPAEAAEEHMADVAVTVDRAAQFKALAALVDFRVLKGMTDGDGGDKAEHPFAYCMETVVPAIIEKGGEVDDPKAFCGWWKGQRDAMRAASAARLVGFQAIRSLLDQVTDALGQAVDAADQLVANEPAESTDAMTFEQVRADGEAYAVASARLRVLLAYCAQAAGLLCGAKDLAYAHLPELAPSVEPTPGYMEGRDADAATHRDLIQRVHDHAAKLGASCADVKAAESAQPPTLKAACGCTPQGDSTMNKTERAKALIDNPITPWAESDQKYLEGLTDERLSALEAHATQLKAAADKADADKAAAEQRAAEQKAAADQAAADKAAAEQRAAAAAQPKTEEEYLASAPASIVQIVADFKAAAAAKKTELVATLKAAQSEFTEDELKAMELAQLERLARVAGAAQPPSQRAVDYGPRGPRRDDEKDEVPPPPDLTARILEARKATVN